MLFLGLLVAGLSTFLMNYGVFLLKREVDLLPRLGVHGTLRTIWAFLTSRAWLKAQGLQLAGGFLHIVAIGLAPLSLVEPVDTAGICFLVILTVLYLGERASITDWIGIGVIILGIIMLAVSVVQPHEDFSYNPIITGFFILLLSGIVIYSFFVAFSRRGEEVSAFVGLGLGVLIGLNAILIKLGLNDMGNLWKTYHFASLWHSSYAMMALFGSIVAQVFFQVALQRGRALLVVPLVTGFSNMIPIVVGVLALKEPFPTEFRMVVVRLFSFVFIIGGAIILSIQGEHQEPAAPVHGVT
ncbi:MAG: hypothetical protein ACYC55_06125 [Candidatus Geothermincolia bacterium]